MDAYSVSRRPNRQGNTRILLGAMHARSAVVYNPDTRVVTCTHACSSALVALRGARSCAYLGRLPYFCPRPECIARPREERIAGAAALHGRARAQISRSPSGMVRTRKATTTGSYLLITAALRHAKKKEGIMEPEGESEK